MCRFSLNKPDFTYHNFINCHPRSNIKVLGSEQNFNKESSERSFNFKLHYLEMLYTD